MDASSRTHLAFHLTGRTLSPDLDPVDPLSLQPVLLARYRDLTALRYDFPLVLVHGGGGRPMVQSLSGLIDEALRAIAGGEADERIASHALRLEREIRTLVAHGATGSLSALWDAAALRVDAGHVAHWRDSVDRLRAALTSDGEVVDCDADMPAALFHHLWTAIQDAKARQFHARVSRLLLQLGNILRADFVRSAAGRTADYLKASLGTTRDEVFDFDAMASVLGRGTPPARIDDARRRRIEHLIEALDSQRFYPRAEPRQERRPPYPFVFQTCEGAQAAYRERAPEMAELARAMAAAELEVQGDYRDSHDVFFGQGAVDDAPLDPEAQALFPDYLVTLNAGSLTPIEQATLIEMLAAGLPVKVLLQTDDLLDEPSTTDGAIGAGARSHQLAHLAIGFNDVYVMQVSASHLFQYRDRVEAGLRYPGAAIFSVFSGSTGVNDLPDYLVAAAAMESRAFPAFTFDPSAGTDWASRFSLDGNPHLDADWSVRSFSYEDDSHQELTEDLAFTAVDFIACDPRHGRHFARVPRPAWNGHLVPVTEALTSTERTGTVPSLLMVDAANVLHKVLAGESMLREARRYRQMWRSLQELAGIHNSHVERRLAREPERPADEVERPAAQAGRSAFPASVAEAPAAAAAPVDASPDDPYIETPRCTTCNECTGVNKVMFAYNENKQAYVANPGAGTYADLVQAAESCQVSIIHPGKPRNPDEPGLAELLKRAEPFL